MIFLIKQKNFMAPFYGRGSTASRLEPLRGGSLLFTTKFPEIHGIYSIFHPLKDERLSQPWSDSVVLNMGHRNLLKNLLNRKRYYFSIGISFL